MLCRSTHFHQQLLESRHRLQLAETCGSDPGAGAFVLVHHRLLDAAVLKAQKIRVDPLYTKKDGLKYKRTGEKNRTF